MSKNCRARSMLLAMGQTVAPFAATLPLNEQLTRPVESLLLVESNCRAMETSASVCGVVKCQ